MCPHRKLPCLPGPIPPVFEDTTSLEFSHYCAGSRRCASPGIGFGEYGDNHVRIALVENEQRTRQRPKPATVYGRAFENGRPHGRVVAIGLAGLGTVGVEVAGRLLNGAVPGATLTAVCAVTRRVTVGSICRLHAGWIILLIWPERAMLIL